MDRFFSEEEKEQRRQESLERHSQLHRLFVDDRLGFERERKRMLDEFFDGIEDEEMKTRLRALQKAWDRRLKHAGSAHNRFVLAQTFFWEHFFDSWFPAVREFSSLLNPESP